MFPERVDKTGRPRDGTLKPSTVVLDEIKTVFEWSPAAKESFDKIKRAVSDSTTLSYFDARKPVVLQVDASMKTLGTALIQDGKPVAFASKALSPAESRYANIERELLAVVYG